MLSNSVYQKQNKKENIIKLMAIRRLYSNAKFVNKVNFIFSVIIPVLISLAKILFDRYNILDGKIIIPYLGYYGIAVLIFTILTTGLVSNLKKKAATIQDMFDCDVLDIKWNEIKVGKKISPLEIHKSAKHYANKKTTSQFKDWYFKENHSFNKHMAALLCQNENIGWDLSQRIILNRLLLLIIFFSAISMISYGIYYNTLLTDSLFYIVFMLPLFRHFYLQLIENKKTIEKCSRINDAIEKTIEANLNKKEVELNELNYIIRSIQDEIFTHRISNHPVPNIIHKIFKTKNEEQYKQHFEYYLEKTK